MRILTVSGPLCREFGGPPLAVAGASSSIALLGHQVEVLVCGQSESSIRINSVLFDKLRRSGSLITVLSRKKESIYGASIRLHELKKIWRLISDADFVMLHQVFELQYIVIFPIIFCLRKPFAVMPHGTLTIYQRKQHKFRKCLFAPATFIFLNSASAIFVATNQELNQLPRSLKKKGKVVGLGIEVMNRQNKSPTNTSSQFNLLYMGRIAKKKRLDIALRSFALMHGNSEMKMKFIVCGSGDETYMEQLKQLVINLQIETAVEFRGWVDSTEKEFAFLESNCFILTSEDENFAIAAAEALSYGIPCILSSKVALSSLVFKHSSGIIFEKFEPLEIMSAINSICKTDREVLRNAALQAASELRWDSISRNWERAIRELI